MLNRREALKLALAVIAAPKIPLMTEIDPREILFPSPPIPPAVGFAVNQAGERLTIEELEALIWETGKMVGWTVETDRPIRISSKSGRIYLNDCCVKLTSEDPTFIAIHWPLFIGED